MYVVLVSVMHRNYFVEMNNDLMKVLMLVVHVRILLLIMVKQYYHEEYDDLVLIDLLELLDDLLVPDMKRKFVLFIYLKIIFTDF
jgi:hypothetical protein